MMNHVVLMGNLTRDPELKKFGKSTLITKFGIAVNRFYRDREGENQKETGFFEVTTFARQAELCSQYLYKGRKVVLEGRLKFEQWEGKDGVRKNRVSIVAEHVEFLGAPKSEYTPVQEKEVPF